MSFKVVGLGEVLWDLFPTGKSLGGAPANFAYHAHTMGADARVVSRVGRDELGGEIIARLQSSGLLTEGCVSVDDSHPTGTVVVEVDGEGQPRYTICEDVAWDHLVADAAALAAVAEADALCFGSLAQRRENSREAIRALLAAAPGALRIFDVNLRQCHYSREIILGSLEAASVLKLNEEELATIAAKARLENRDARHQIQELVERFENLRLVIYTRGARGCCLYNGKNWSEHAGRPVTVRDTVGAGDALTAAIAMGWLAGWDLETIGGRANEIAAYVCSREGATPPIPERLRELYLA